MLCFFVFVLALVALPGGALAAPPATDRIANGKMTSSFSAAESKSKRRGSRPSQLTVARKVATALGRAKPLSYLIAGGWTRGEGEVYAEKFYDFAQAGSDRFTLVVK